MSVQVHCDHCDRSLHTRKPYGSDNLTETESTMVRLFKDGHYGFDSGQNGWAFCDRRCAGLYFLTQDANEAQSAATEK